MADVRMEIPFLPQASQTAAILSAMQLANEEHAARVRNQLAAQAQPSEIALRSAETSRYNAQTELDKMNMDLRRELVGTLTGSTPGSAAATAPSGQTAPAPNASAPPVPGASAAPSQVGTSNLPPLNPNDFGSPVDYLRAVAARSGQQTLSPAPASAPARGGLIGQTVDGLLADPSLTTAEREAITLSGRVAMLKAHLEPEKSLDGVVSTYNDILKQKGEMARAIKTETAPDSQSSTGYSMVGTKADGAEAYRHPAPPPVPKNLEEASSFLGSASLNYQRDPTDGNKAALDLFNAQHDAMYKDKIAEASQQARATAQAQGKDVEAMFRTGVNPITKEKLSLNNAPPGALVNPATGEAIPQDMVSLYKPTMTERQTADTARQVLAISGDLKAEITKNPNLIGPLAGRSQEALQNIGISARDAAKLIDDVTFLQSAATKMHTGRFSSEILHKMGTIIKPGMGKEEFLGSLDSINDVANRYANEDKLTTVYEYQQRQQFESQGVNAGAAISGVAQKHGFQ